MQVLGHAQTRFRPVLPARKSFLSANCHEAVAAASFIRYTHIFFAVLRLELGTKNISVCLLFPFPKQNIL